MAKRQTGKEIVSAERIDATIRLLRGHRVVLSTDAAALYGVEPRALVQAVKRNPSRFPPDFMFQLSGHEWSTLKSQTVISNAVGRGGARTPPYAFTEQGIAMLSSILRSDRAVRVNVEIMRAFVRLRQMIATNDQLSRRLDELEHAIVNHDEKFAAVFDAIRQLMTEPKEKKRPPVGFQTEATRGKK
jgi:hypothetical protein